MAADFQRNLYRYEAKELGEARGSKVWSGELAVEPKLNAEVTTAFPVAEAVGTLAPGVYAMTAAAEGVLSEDYDQLATQWFIVSDLGLTAYSTHDGVDVFVHSLASAEPKAATDVRLMARSNEQLAARRTDANGFVHFEAGLCARRGRHGAGGNHRQRDRRLRLSQPEGRGFRSFRSRRCRAAGAGRA